jgi:hypothetical protein
MVAKSVDRSLDPALGVERRLGLPDIEMDAQVLQTGLDAMADPIGRPATNFGRGTISRAGGGEDGGRDLVGQVGDIGSAVAILGYLAALEDGKD